MKKIFFTLAYLIKRLLFDSNEELDMTSSRFNSKRTVVFLVVVLLLVFNFFLAKKISILAIQVIEQQDIIQDCSKLCEKNINLPH